MANQTQKSKYTDLKILMISKDLSENDPRICLLKSHGLDIKHVPSNCRSVKISRENKYDITLIDIDLNELECGSLLLALKENNPQTTCIIWTSKEKVDLAMACLREGAFDFLLKDKDKSYFTEQILNICDRIREK